MPVSVLGAAALGAGLNTLGGVLQSTLSQGAQRAAEDRAYYRQLELMQKQNSWNSAMWERANRYNSPANQLKLMQEAGLNPALFDMRGQSPASELTAASGDAPYNSGAGSEYSQLGLSQVANPVIAALQTDAQIAKLRTDIKYQELVNRDLGNQLAAKEQKMDNLSNEYDEDGRSMTIYPDTNAYEEERQRGRVAAKREAVGYSREFDEYRGFLQDFPFLRDMTQKQLQSLAQDIKSKELNNDLLSEDVRMMKTYGISSQDKNEWTALLRAALHDPENIYRILEALGTAGSRTFQNIIESFGTGQSHRNPSMNGSGSW